MRYYCTLSHEEPLDNSLRLATAFTKAVETRFALPMQLPCSGFLASLIKTRRHAFGVCLSRAPCIDAPNVEAIKRHSSPGIANCHDRLTQQVSTYDGLDIFLSNQPSG
jgi:hypothetical protein